MILFFLSLSVEAGAQGGDSSDSRGGYAEDYAQPEVMPKAKPKVKPKAKKAEEEVEEKKEEEAEVEKEEKEEVFLDTSRQMYTEPAYEATSARIVLDETTRELGIPPTDLELRLYKERHLSFKGGVASTYNDNIYLSRDNAQKDAILHASLGATAIYGTKIFIVACDYGADYMRYFLNPKENATNQNLSIAAELLRGHPRLHITFKNDLRPTTLPSDSESTAPKKRIYDHFDGTVIYDLNSKLSLGLGYDYVMQHYTTEADKTDSYNIGTYQPTVYWRFSPKTTLSFEYDYGIIKYPKKPSYDATFFQPLLGIEGRLTPKTSLKLKAGYQWRHYEERSDEQDMILRGILQYAFTPKTYFEILVSNGINESIYADAGTYRSINVFMSMQHTFNKKLSGRASAFYLKSMYPDNIARTDETFGYAFRVDYRFKRWLALFVEYMYRLRTSDVDAARYRNNSVSFGYSVAF